ncbi:hypothetical protein PT285_07240 [Lactobacillus sp. ESL0791]|uniref:hypothetical protein n=1 Tax=Lactobacillus sp. ESL0791 TaxID=2983234 RepID=UPI0023F86575|nr:hypothetical protein [Lactobacillus sp. ESL0791]MDF7639193.1 hypothetical protein [Lactobacillus sp. ESL0791]
MEDKHDFVEVKLDSQRPKLPPTKALQLGIGQNKTVIVYNRIQDYILQALLEAVFDHDH